MVVGCLREYLRAYVLWVFRVMCYVAGIDIFRSQIHVNMCGVGLEKVGNN